MDERRTQLGPLSQLSRGAAGRFALRRGSRPRPHPADRGPAYRWARGCHPLPVVHPIPAGPCRDRGRAGAAALCGISLAATTAALLRAASGQGRAVGGAVRVSASEVIGAEVLPPILARLREDHPALEIELVLSNAVDNLLRRDADIAVRMVEPIQEALVVKRVGAVTLGLHAHRTYLARAGAPRDVKDLRTHSLIGFDRETPAIRSMLQRAPALDGLRFALRTDSDTAQLMAIKAGFGIGVCQTALARRDRDLERVLPDAFALELGVWLAMHENLRSTPRCRAVFDGLAAGLKAHVD